MAFLAGLTRTERAVQLLPHQSLARTCPQSDVHTTATQHPHAENWLLLLFLNTFNKEKKS